MARVTDAEVKAIKPTSFDTTPHIDCANLIVSDINSKCGKSFDEVRLTCIELYLAAHFVGNSDPAVKSRSFEGASVSFQVGNQSLKGILSDSFGQTANALSEGCLQMIDLQPATVDLL